MRAPRIVVAALACWSLHGPASAQEDGGTVAEGAGQAPELSADCTIVDSSQYISVVVCDPAQDAEAYTEAGRAVCGDRPACGVWFWTSRDDAPETAPGNHDELTQEQIISAEGVWSAVDNVFIRIERDE